jgi:hypothetical protein
MSARINMHAKATRRSIVIAGLFCALFGMGASRVRRDSSPGTVYRTDPRDGVLETRGEQVQVGIPISTADEVALLELEEGAVLKLDPNSALVLEGTAPDLFVRTLSGQVSLVGRSGRIVRGGAGSRFRVPLAEIAPEAAEQQLLADPAVRARHRSRGLEVEVGDDRQVVAGHPRHAQPAGLRGD